MSIGKQNGIYINFARLSVDNVVVTNITVCFELLCIIVIKYKERLSRNCLVKTVYSVLQSGKR